MIRSLLAALVLSVSFFSWIPIAAQAGHDLPDTERQIIPFRAACADLDALTALVEATHKGDERFRAVWSAVMASRLCFSQQTSGAFERVVTVMEWGDAGRVVIVEVHDQDGQVVYTWFTKEFWDRRGMKPSGVGV